MELDFGWQTMTEAELPAHRRVVEARRRGVIYGLAAYFCWGFFPVYFKSVQVVPPLEMVAHRICWSLAFLLVLIAWKGAWRAVSVVTATVPGAAWLQFETAPEGAGTALVQTAGFAPRGLAGLLYWYGLYPVHGAIFSGMIAALAVEAGKPVA